MRKSARRHQKNRQHKAADTNPEAEGQEGLDGHDAKPGPSFTVEALEPRILLSATWAEVDTGDAISAPTEGADAFTGSDGADVADALGGDDTLSGGDGDDILSGGDGDDLLSGDSGNDTLAGDAGDDSLSGGAGDDTLDGGAGTDTATYADADSAVTVDLDAGTATGGAGNDVLTDVENVTGSDHDDTLTGDGSANVLDGGAGDDTLVGGEGADTLSGDKGEDTLYGGGGNDILYGGDKADSLYGGDGDDILYGNKHADVLDGGTGDDQIHGGDHTDTLISGGGNDAMYGDKHDDVFQFTGAQDGDVITVDGGQHDDTLDLSPYNTSQISDNGSSLGVDLGGGQSFTVNYSNIENITTADGTYDPGSIPAGDQPPIAEAGLDQTVNEGDSVALDASGSSDPEGQGLTYTWTQTGGPSVNLSDANAAQPTFNAPEGTSNTTLTFQVEASDGTNTSVDTVTIAVNADDDAPTAEAGANQTVNEGDSVTLDATGSSDPEGQGLTYTWTQTGGPSVNLSDANAAQPTFNAPEGTANTTLTFQMEASDGTNTSVDTVTIAVNADNDAPTAEAGANQTVNEGESVALDASGSSDPEGQGLTYAWTQTGGPSVSLSDANAAQPTFNAPEGTSNTTLTFQVQASDGTNTSIDTVTIAVNADNDAPTAEAGPDQVVTRGTPIQLSGSGTDPEQQGLTYEWVQTSGPEVTLNDPNSMAPTFAAPPGVGEDQVSFELRVSDGQNTSVDTVTVTLQADQIPQATTPESGQTKPGGADDDGPADEPEATPEPDQPEATDPAPEPVAPTPPEADASDGVGEPDATDVPTTQEPVAEPSGADDPTPVPPAETATGESGSKPDENDSSDDKPDWDGTEQLEVLDPMADVSDSVTADETLESIKPPDPVDVFAAVAGAEYASLADNQGHQFELEGDVTLSNELDGLTPVVPFELPSGADQAGFDNVFEPVEVDETLVDGGTPGLADTPHRSDGVAAQPTRSDAADRHARDGRGPEAQARRQFGGHVDGYTEADGRGPDSDASIAAQAARTGFFARMWGMLRGTAATSRAADNANIARDDEKNTSRRL